MDTEREKMEVMSMQRADLWCSWGLKPAPSRASSGETKFKRYASSHIPTEA